MDKHTQMYRQSYDNHNFLDQWVTKFSKVWGSACTQIPYTRAPLILHNIIFINFVNYNGFAKCFVCIFYQG